MLKTDASTWLTQPSRLRRVPAASKVGEVDEDEGDGEEAAWTPAVSAQQRSTELMNVGGREARRLQGQRKSEGRRNGVPRVSRQAQQTAGCPSLRWRGKQGGGVGGLTRQAGRFAGARAHLYMRLQLPL